MGRILGSIGEEGRVEEMCEAAGLVSGKRRFVRFDIEMGPEVEDLVRASVSPGATYMAVKERGLDVVEEALRRDFTPLWDEAIGLRIGVVIEYLLATKPG